jgi:predicted transposase/invertase (TIGR01784 family)
MRLLLQDKMINKEMKREYIQKLFVFIDHILRLPEETEKKLVNDLKPIIQKEAVQMGLSMKDTFLAKYYMKEGEKKGRQEGIKEGIKKGIKEGKIEGKIEGKMEVVSRLLEKGYSVEDAADITGLSIEEIKRLKNTK